MNTKLKKIIKGTQKITAFSLIFLMIFSWTYGLIPGVENFSPNVNIAQASNPTARQEINLIDGEITATSSAISVLDTSKFPTGTTYYFETVAKVTSGTASLCLYSNLMGQCDSTISVTETSYTLKRSVFSPSSSISEYNVGVYGGSGVSVFVSRIIAIVPGNSSGNFDSMETQIEIGDKETALTNTSSSALTNPKYWYYDSSKWGANTTSFTVSATYSLTPGIVASSTTYSTSGTHTWVAPSIATSTKVELWGGGGAGGAATGYPAGGGGGAGGCFASSTITTTPNSSYSVVVGAGGTIVTGGKGNTGGDSTFNSTTVVAKGGAGGGVASSNNSGGTGGSGSTSGCVGTVLIAGANGETGVGSTSGYGGAGGKGGNGGAGGARQTTANSTGNSGTAPGGAGGGGYTTKATDKQGGAGAIGKAVMSYYAYDTSASVDIILQEDDGSFGSWTDKATLVSGGSSTSAMRVSVSFTPTSGRNYRIVAKMSGSGNYSIYNGSIIVDQTSSVKKFEAQYLLANTKLASGTSYQNFLTKWDPSEWSGITTTFIHEIDSASNSTSAVGIYASNVLMTDSSISSSNYRARSSGITLPSSSNLDIKATTNNNDVYASRILVQVANVSPTTVLNTADNYNFGNNPNPTLEFTATDLESNNVRYQIQIASTSDFGASGSFVIQNAGTKGWNSVDVNKTSNDVYAVVYGGDIYKQTGGTGSFVAQSAGTKNWNSVAINQSTGDVYVTVYGDDIYKQTGGTGSFSTLSAGTKNWEWITINQSTGDVYAVVLNGDIYKQTGGTGSFVIQNAGTKYWQMIDVNQSTGDVYAGTTNGDIYKQTGGTGSFVAQGIGLSGWQSMAINQSTGDVYAGAYNGDIYKQTGGTGSFVAQNAGTKNWYSFAINQSNNDVYAVVSNGDIYKQTGGTGSFVAQNAGTKNWWSISINQTTGDVYAAVSNGDIYKQSSNSTLKTSGTNSGFANTVTTSDTDPFNSGEKVSFTVQSGDSLSSGTYYWRVRAIDPNGSNTYGSWATSRSFTVSVSSGITISGTAYTNLSGDTDVGQGYQIDVYKNGTLLNTASTGLTGGWSLTASISSGDVISVLKDRDLLTEGSYDNLYANTIFISDGTDKTDINLYGDTLTVRSDTSSAITNANLLTGAIHNSTAMIYSTSTNDAITLISGESLYVPDNNSYYPNGKITTQGTGGLYLGSNASTTLKYSGTGPNLIAGDVTINSGATLNINNSTTVSGNVINSGSLAGSGDFTVNGGSISGSGSVSFSSGTLTLDGTGNFGGGGNWTFNKLVFGDGSGVSTTTTLGSGSITAATTTISANQILDAGSGKIWNLTTSHNPFEVYGTLIASTSDFIFNGSDNTTIPATTYYNIEISPSSGNPIYTLGTGSGQSMVVNKDFVVDGSGSVTIDANTYDPSLDINGNLTIGNNDTFLASNSSPFSVAGNFTNSGSFTHNNGTVTFDTTTTSVISSDNSMSFYNFTSIVPNKTLRFAKHSSNIPTFTFENIFNINGQSVSSPIYIESNTGGSQWMVSFSTPQTSVTYASVKDSACAIGSYGVSYSGTNSGRGNDGDCWNLANSGSKGDSTITSVEMGSGGGSQRSGGIKSDCYGICSVEDSDGGGVGVTGGSKDDGSIATP